MAQQKSAGYSGTPLVKKLGLKPDYQCLTFNEPSDYWTWLSPLPKEIKVRQKSGNEEMDFIHLFVKEKKTFEKEFLRNKKYLKKDGTLWISWPKKASKVPTDLDENIIRDFGLANGLVDVKVCAVDDVWSGLKFMYRTKDR
jgi:hypothetical protein